MTFKEAKDLSEPLSAALADYFKYADDFLWEIDKSQAERPIWTAIDSEDREKLCSILLKWAQKSEIVSTAVQAFVDSHDGLVLFAILGPPAYETAKILAPRGRRRKGSAA